MIQLSLFVNCLLSVIGGVITYYIILDYIPVFLKRKMCGKDMCKVTNASFQLLLSLLSFSFSNNNLITVITVLFSS